MASSIEAHGVLASAEALSVARSLEAHALPFAISQFTITLDGVLSMLPITQATIGLLPGQHSRSRIQRSIIKRCRKNLLGIQIAGCYTCKFS